METKRETGREIERERRPMYALHGHTSVTHFIMATSITMRLVNICFHKLYDRLSDVTTFGKTTADFPKVSGQLAR